MRLLYQGAGGTILALVNDADEYYIVQMVGKVGKKNYQAALRTVIKNLAENDYPHFLLNAKDLQSQPDLAGYWFWAHFVPRYYKRVGKCRIAILREKQTFWHRQFSKVGGLLKAGRMNIEVEFFTDLNTAQDWLIDGILPAQTTLRNAIQKKLTAFKNPFKKNKSTEKDDDEPIKKKNFLIQAWDWVRHKLSLIPFFKNVKVRVKFDPKGQLRNDADK